MGFALTSISIMPNSYDNWREDHGLVPTPIYKKKFAFTRKMCSDNSTVLWKVYYKKYVIWNHGENAYPYDEGYYHTDFVENVTEADYMVRLLSGNL